MTTDDPARLITEADRQRALTVLRRAAEDGRLTPTALDERSRRVREVLLVGQLDDVLEGLRPTRDTDLLWPNSERATASPPARTSASQPALPVPAGHRADDRLVLGGGMASDKRAGVWVLPPYLRVLPRLGSIRLDCRRAHAETAVIDIEVGIGAGSVVLVLPEGWAANAERLKKGVGDVKVKVAPTPASDCPTIFLHGQAGLGSVVIRHANWFERTFTGKN